MRKISGNRYIKAIKPRWESCWLTNMGTYHQEPARELKNFLKFPELTLMINGHMDLEMAIQAFEFPRGSKTIATPFMFMK